MPRDLGKVDVGFTLHRDTLALRLGPWEPHFALGPDGLALTDLWASLIELVDEGESEWLVHDRPGDLNLTFDVDGPTVTIGIFGTGRYRGLPTPEVAVVRLAALVEGLARVLESGLHLGDPELRAKAEALRADLRVARDEVTGLPASWQSDGAVVSLGRRG